MPEKELDYIRSREAADGSSTEKNGGVYIDAFDKQDNAPPLKGWSRFVDGFKRADAVDYGIDPNLSEPEKIAVMTANSPLSRSLKNRHLQMIAIGGSIGTGLFVGSGSVLRTGGPAGLLIGYILIGAMIYCTVQSLGELAVTFPVSGAFVTYNSRFIDPSWGFAMAWNYAMQWLVVLPLELVAAAITVKFWDSHTNSAAFVTIFYVLIVAINFFGVRGYGEAEFVFSIIKVIAVVGFIILGIVLVCGGGPKGGYLGGKYWHNPGAFAHGFKGVCSVFVSAAFAFAGTELCGLAAAETANPRKSLPKATKQVFWRITLFYVISLTLVGLLVPYTDERLIGTSSVDASASPFVLAIKNGGIGGLPSVMNVVIMIAVLSVGNSSVFGSSRTLAALAASGQAPQIFGYIDKRGRPLVGIIVQCVFGLLCYITASSKSGDVFNWLLALSGLSSIFTWMSINLCLIRFRRALYAQGRDTSELTFTSQVGVYGAIFGAGLNILVLIAQFWIAVWPLGDKPNAENFFMSYLGFPVVLVFYIPHKLWKRTWRLYIPAKEIDIDTGRRELDLDLVKQEIVEEKAYIASLPFYKRVYHFWC
ncbi:general amino acid permease [Scheffersomyces stipitis CBS 6054]|uniref:General amino acid permease n=1 Tax=Scheffersomyces stipitis (strain ATCC 58785 / CBS 6054 / NBRC 10063 / NRRL Y-11545) TaxID=322104 RepID=A3LNX9_PICST|nr:general amino acid permease [Scheffersomyces stipitis CBS 6054]ABN64947.1 general amino acid permease [Scheffersomyces stipitis CBS 6054]